MVKDTILYDNLEITPDASEVEIKKAYNRLSKLWHPDKHSQASPSEQEEAKIKFQTINQAKEILIDKEKREAYDQIGVDFLKGGADAGEHPFGDFGNMFSQGFPFGGMPGMPGGMRQQQPEQENIIQEIEVTLDQIYNGNSIDFSYKYKHYCTKCDGEGTKNMKKSKCMQCDGKGMKVNIIKRGPMIQQTVGPCSFCRGTGIFIDEMNKCETCESERFIIKDKTISIPLKSGLSNGDKISLSGKGHQFKNSKTDIILVINLLNHHTFKRLKDDLFIEIELKLYQSLFGFDKIINHLDGRQLHISCSGKTDFNCARKITGEGMTKINSPQKKGDLYVQFKVSVPNLPLEVKTQLKPILQNFDKQEVQNENAISKMTNLTKTVMNDCKADNIEKLLKAINENEEKHHKSKHSNPHYEQEGQPQCSQS
jgi:DnaJ family protein A protein 2